MEDLSEHIDSMAASSHYFVIDPSETAIIDKNMGSVSFLNTDSFSREYSGTSEQWTRWGRVFSEVVPSSEVITCIQLLAGGTQFVHCREVVRSSECPLSEVPLYIRLCECVCCGLQFHKRSLVFSDIREKDEGCLNKFSKRCVCVCACVRVCVCVCVVCVVCLMKERALCGPLLMCDKSLIAITTTLPVFACTYVYCVIMVLTTILACRCSLLQGLFIDMEVPPPTLPPCSSDRGKIDQYSCMYSTAGQTH